MLDLGKTVFGVLEEGLNNSSTLHLLGLKPLFDARLQRMSKKWSLLWEREQTVHAEMDRGSKFLSLLTEVVIIGLGAFLVSWDRLSLGAFIAFFASVQSVTDNLLEVVTAWQIFEGSKADLARLTPLVLNKDRKSVAAAASQVQF